MKTKKTKILGIIILSVIIICCVSIFLLQKIFIEKEYVKKVEYNGLYYYVIQNEYDKDYDLQKINLDNNYKDFNKYEIMNYKDYSSFCDKWNLNKKYNNTNDKYMVISYAHENTSILDVKLAGTDYEGKKLNIYIWDRLEIKNNTIGAYSIIFPIEKEIEEFNVISVINEDELENLK